MVVTTPITGGAPAATDPRREYARLQFNAMDTTCLVIFAARSHAAAASLKEQILQWVRNFENHFSRFIPGSLIGRINAAAGDGTWFDLDDEARSLFALCDWFNWSTHGVFDPATLPLMRIWDYHSSRNELPGEDEVRRMLELCGWSKLDRADGRVRLPAADMGLDLGGIGKEYAVDRVFEMARATGVEHILVNFGNDLRMRGEPPEGGPWRIGLEDPAQPGMCWDGVAVTDRAVTTSGDYHRHIEIGGRRYGHIIDPRTGYPVSNGCHAVTVVAPTCTEAGVFSTTAFILGPREGLDFVGSFPQAEACIITDRHVSKTRRFDEYRIAS